MKITMTYDQINARATRTGKCPGCGRTTRRTRTFSQTENPFNRTADKSRPKTYEEILASVRAQAAAWQPDAEMFRHAAC